MDHRAHCRAASFWSLLAACLGMISIATEVFWSPMAFAMIGGIVVATVLTLPLLPALYVTWHRIKEPV